MNIDSEQQEKAFLYIQQQFNFFVTWSEKYNYDKFKEK